MEGGRVSWAGFVFWVLILGLLLVVVGLIGYAMLTVAGDEDKDDKEEMTDDDRDD